MKKVAFLTYNEKIIFIEPVREIESVKYLELKEEARKNLEELVKEFQEREQRIIALEEIVKQLQSDIKLLKGEEEDEWVSSKSNR